MTSLGCRGIICLLATLLGIAGCALKQSGRVQGVEGGIGDDICALMLKLVVDVKDWDKNGVGGAEVWKVNEPRLSPPEPTRAQLLGVTDSVGRWAGPECYMGSSEFSVWNSEAHPVRLVLMILRDGYGVERRELRPPTSDVLKAGNLLGVPPGEAFHSSELKPDPTWRERGYELVVDIVLSPAVKR